MTIIQTIITTTTCPLTILLDILVILAVKKTPRLQSNPNIMLACLAATDAFIGLAAQSSYILSATFQVSGLQILAQAIRFHWHDRAILAGVTNSLLHLMLVTFERLVAINFTNHYPFLITEKNVKVIYCNILGHCSILYVASEVRNTYILSYSACCKSSGALLHDLHCYFLRDFVSRDTSSQGRNETNLNNYSSPVRSGNDFKGKQGLKNNSVYGRLSRSLFRTIIFFISIRGR